MHFPVFHSFFVANYNDDPLNKILNKKPVYETAIFISGGNVLSKSDDDWLSFSTILKILKKVTGFVDHCFEVLLLLQSRKIASKTKIFSPSIFPFDRNVLIGSRGGRKYCEVKIVISVLLKVLPLPAKAWLQMTHNNYHQDSRHDIF